MLILGLLFGLIVPTLLGNIILHFLDRKKILSPLENLSISFLLGEGAITLLLFWSFFINLPYRVYIIGSAIVVLFILKMLFLDRGNISNKFNLKFGDLIQRLKKINFLSLKNILIILILALIFIKVFYAFVETCSKPEYSWDASMNWTRIGKHFFYLNQELPEQMLNMLKGQDYPKQISFMHFWLFSWMGQANDQWSKIIFPIGLICFMFLFYTSIKKIRGDFGAIVFTYFLISTPLFLYHSTIGYGDFTDSIFFSLGIFFFYRWIREKQDVYFWLFSIFISLTTWIKFEGKAFLAMGFILLLLYLWRTYKKQIKPILIKASQYLLVFMIVGFPWQFFVFINGAMSSREKLAFHLKYFFKLHSEIYKMLFVQGSWGIVWIGIIAAIIFFFKRLFTGENIYLSLTILLFYGIILFTYLFTSEAYKYTDSSFNRIWLSIYPIAIFTAASIIPRFKEL